jgi:hypothetical protein
MQASGVWLKIHSSHTMHPTMQIDAGSTFSEPTAIISGVVEGMEEVGNPVQGTCKCTHGTTFLALTY